MQTACVRRTFQAGVWYAVTPACKNTHGARMPYLSHRERRLGTLTVGERAFPVDPLQNWLLTPESQWQSRGKRRISQGGAVLAVGPDGDDSGWGLGESMVLAYHA
jgi:hypothetical protein